MMQKFHCLAALSGTGRQQMYSMSSRLTENSVAPVAGERAEMLRALMLRLNFFRTGTEKLRPSTVRSGAASFRGGVVVSLRFLGEGEEGVGSELERLRMCVAIERKSAVCWGVDAARVS